MQTLYSLFNQNTKKWWYHVKLRGLGQDKEARRLERQSILSSVASLRCALDTSKSPWAYCMVSPYSGQWTLYYSREGCGVCSHSGYGGLDEPIPASCIRLGIPVLDLSSMDQDSAIECVLGSPLVDVRGRVSKQPWNSFSYATLDFVFNRYASFGATLYNYVDKTKPVQQNLFPSP